MLFSLAIILLLGLCAGALFARLRLPALMGMLLAGIAIGPHALNLIDDSLLAISADIRRIALIVILMRAGLSLNLDDLKRVGRPAVLMCFVPATFEVLGMVLLAPRLLGLSLIDAAVLGAVIGAVSPAVIVPKMLRLMETGWGADKRIPQLLLAGASVDMRYAVAAGPSAALLILCVLLFRMAGVCLCLIKTPLTRRERLFCMIAFLPKATVQAAIGGLPLAMGLSCGEIVLTVAVLSILITAPLGALLIDTTYPRLLTLSDVVPGGQETA